MIGLGTAWCMSAFASSQPKTRTLSDLPTEAQSSISAALGQRISDYGAKCVSQGFRTTDLHQRLTSDFRDDGVTFRSGSSSWTMKVSAYGRDKNLRSVPKATAQVDSNRVEYRREGLTEWYLNGPLGLEQGFTVNQPIGGKARGPLTVALTLSGDFFALEQNKRSLEMIGGDGKAQLYYTGLAARDADDRDLDAWLDLRGNRLLIQVDDHNARYPVVIDPWVQVAEVSTSNGGNSDEFGWSVAGGNGVVVVGAPFHTVGSNVQQGAAYVFVEPANGWGNSTEGFELVASDGVANAYFGASVAMNGNVVVVGAVGTTINGNPRQGAAYVFVQPSGGWQNMTETGELTASDGYVGDNLGNSVAITGNTVVAGAPYASIGSNFEQGAAYVFEQPADGWQNVTQTAKLTASDGAAGDILGVAVNIDSDTVVLGASEATVGGNASAGAAYVFVESTNGWGNMTQTAKLTASDAAADDYFGSAVDINNGTIVVGAPSDFTGAVYVFVEPQNGWNDMTQTAELTPSVTTAEFLLGGSVAISGNIVAAGAAAASVGGNPNVGEVMVFVEPPAGWRNMTQTTQLFGKGATGGDSFGRSISIGGNAGIAGAPFHVNGTSQGSGFIFQSLNTRPVLGSLDPSNTAAGGSGFLLTVYGSNFVGGTVVNWNGSPRNTTFVSPTEVQAAILASDIAQPGTFRVTATNPPPGGGTSNSLAFTVQNPVPSIVSLKPSSTTAGGVGFTLTVNGSNFVSKSKVLWNGADRVTTFVSSTELTADILAHDIAQAGTANVNVFNPTPGGGDSNTATFTIDNPVPSLAKLVPSSIKAGSAGFTLAVNGTNFVPTSQVYWNGSPRATTFVGHLNLQATILASDVKTPGTAKVTVGNPAPGGGSSNSLTFTINQ